MTWTTTIDARPHVMGNMMMVTGTFLSDSGDTGGDIVLTNVLSSIVAAGANANAAGATDTEIVAGGANALSTTAGTGSGVDGVFASINAATPSLVLNHVAGQDGTWWALGNRS